MKIKIISTIFITTLIFLSAFAPAFAALRAEPVARSPFGQRDRYETDLFTGSAVYSYPINVPKGTDDLTPEVSLEYNSAGAKDFRRYIGSGWQLNQDYVERDVNFTPHNLNDDKFKLHFKGGVYDLIFVSSENRYHTKTESFLNIQKLSGGQNQLSAYWQVITQDGTKYRFGYQDQSELLCNGQGFYMSTWSLDQVEDTHGNKIFYTYFGESVNSYTSKIEYNNDKSRVIELVYGTTPYDWNTRVQGCIVAEAYRLDSIKVKTNGILVRQYDLNYGPSVGVTRILQSITEKGSDGTALPATTFTYKPENKNWTTLGVDWLDSANIDTHLNMTAVAMADVNGDGLIDIVRTGTDGRWRVLLNLGDKWSAQFQDWVSPAIETHLDDSDARLIDVTGDNLPDIVRATTTAGTFNTWKVWRNSGSSWNSTPEVWLNQANIDTNLQQTRTVMADVNGDGLTDILKSNFDVNPTVWDVFKNLGNNTWHPERETWTAPSHTQLGNPETSFIDVNGDSLPDIVKTTHSGTNATWLVFKNNGNGWNQTAETWINNANIDAYLGKEDVTLADADGDGLVDIVKSDDGGGFRQMENTSKYRPELAVQLGNMD